MSSAVERRNARLRGSVKATETWAARGLDPNRRVDVFGFIEEARVWLMFEPLRNLFGFFDREGEVAGIVIHSRHPLSVQRFTAAHELGHYVLGHHWSQDTSRELFRSAADVPLQEIEAQAFAAEFLMPLPVVNRALARLGLSATPAGLDPLWAYQLSLEMGTSYRAAITQLHQLKKIDRADYERLGQVAPVDLKLSVAGHRAADPWADVWLLQEGWMQRDVSLRVGDDLHVLVDEVPSSGYRWALDIDDASPFELVGDGLGDSDGDDELRFGVVRHRHMWLRGARAGNTNLQLRLKRPWEPSAHPAESFSVGVEVHSRRTGSDSEVGLSERQRLGRLAALASPDAD